MGIMASSHGGKESESIDWKYPHWDGEWASFSDYVFRVELKADATREDELAQLGPRLAGNLTGKAFEAIADISRPHLRDKEEWRYLLRHLEQKRGKEKVDVLGDAFSDFFVKKDALRREGEEFADYELCFRTLVRRLDKAVRDSGSEGRIPQELYGWCLLHMYMRMEPSDIANVRGRAESYRLEHVLQALHRMWSGGGLALKDAEKKKRSAGQTLMVEQEDSASAYYEEPDMEESAFYEEDYSGELEEAAAWLHETAVAFNEAPDDPEVYASFQEARKALDKARTARGFYPVRNPNQNSGKGYKSTFGSGKGKGKGTTHQGSLQVFEDFSDKICLRCGKKGHIARICPQKPGGKGKSSPGIRHKIGFVGTIFAVHETKEDFWELDDKRKVLIRHHLCERKKFFHPDVATCPVAVDKLQFGRETRMKSKGEDAILTVQDSWNADSVNAVTATMLWTGQTIFNLIEDTHERKVTFRDEQPLIAAAEDKVPEDSGLREESRLSEPTGDKAHEGTAFAEVPANPLRGKAIIDSGASDNIVGVDTLQDLAEVLEELGFRAEDEIEVDRNMHKNFVYGNNQSSAALGLSHVTTGLCGTGLKIQAHMVEGGTPFLLSSKFLYDMKATINFRTGVGIFEAISNEQIQLERTPGNHLVLPITGFAGNQQILKALQVDQPDQPDANVQKLSSLGVTASAQGNSTANSNSE